MTSDLPVSTVDSILSSSANALVGCWSASLLRDPTLTADEVVPFKYQYNFDVFREHKDLLLVQHNDSWSRILEPLLELRRVGWILWRGGTSSGGTRCETNWFSNYLLGNTTSHKRQSGENERNLHLEIDPMLPDTVWKKFGSEKGLTNERE